MNYLNLKVGDVISPTEGPAVEVVVLGHTLTREQRPTDVELDWYLVRSATRQEYRAETHLVEAGIVVYVPTLARWRRIAGRKERVESPLFPGYLFAGLAEATTIQAAEAVAGVHAVVRFERDRAPRTVSFPMVQKILDAELAGAFDRTRTKVKDPEAGAKFTLVGGPFQGFTAEFVRRRPDERVDVLLHMFGRASPMVLKPNAFAEMIGRGGEDD